MAEGVESRKFRRKQTCSHVIGNASRSMKKTNRNKHNVAQTNNQHKHDRVHGNAKEREQPRVSRFVKAKTTWHRNEHRKSGNSTRKECLRKRERRSKKVHNKPRLKRFERHHDKREKQKPQHNLWMPVQKLRHLRLHPFQPPIKFSKPFALMQTEETEN